MRKKKDNCGYTLIELMAVLIVLSVIIVIAIPVFYKIIEKVKKSAIKSSAHGLMESAELYYINNMDNMDDAVEFKINNGVQVSDYKLKYGGKVKMGYLMLFKGDKMAICVDDGEYAAAKGVNDKNLTVYSGTCTGEYDSETMSYLVSQRTGGFMALSIRSYSSKNDLPTSARSNDLGIITDTKITGYYISGIAPADPEEGLVWVVESPKSPFYLESDNIRLGITYVMQYEAGKWNLKQAYAYNNDWKLLYYVDIASGNVNLENSNLGDISIVNNFGYTGEYQEFTATFSGYYNVQLWGAQGGIYVYAGGLGAYTAGEIYLNAGDTLYVYVGQNVATTTGGWNGGSDSTLYAYGGGGATDIRLKTGNTKTDWSDFESLKSRIMVAAGGGGAMANDSNYGYGAAGGGLIGYTATGVNAPGTGGTQSQAGYDSGNSSYGIGGFGAGGKGTRWTYNGAGGGGYYGGGGGFASGGGGGSSYVSGHSGCSSIEYDSTAANIIHNGSPYHYSGYYFINSTIIDGQGYSWGVKKDNTVINQPKHDGTGSQVGNSGNGYAVITLKSVELKTDNEINNEKNDNQWDYMYSGTSVNEGRYQLFSVPESGYYNIELWGAQGGTYVYAGGLGGYTSGDIYLEEGTKLYIYVGGTTISTAGGWNGGAESTTYSYGGGGASDIRLSNTSKTSIWNEFDSLKSRIMVASGGGSGMSYDVNYGYGGAGGGLVGYSATGVNNPGTGGTQSQAGYDPGIPTYSIGDFGSGGKGTRWTYNGSGGGGYYGGGGGYASGGGGGSSYISGHKGCSSIENVSTATNIIHNGSAFHYNGYYFLNTVMIDGKGYLWGSTKGSSAVNQPNYSNSGTQVGNAGSGHAKITLKSTETLSNDEVLSKKNLEEWDYMYSGTSASVGRYQLFTAEKTGYYNAQLWGAQGGTYVYAGGLGGYTSGEIYLTKGTKFYIYVGGTTTTTTAGWNGGANSTDYAAGSGGASDIRTVNTSGISLWNELPALKSRIMVASGGGSAMSKDGNYGYGAAGGGLIGYTATGVNAPGTGGTQIVGGHDSGNASYSVGGFGYGAIGTRWNYNGSGGGGYYGGGGAYASGGGGGSSYISGHPGCIAVDSSGSPKVTEYTTITDSVNYTGYKFVNTVMIDGQGYTWTTVKSGATGGMPSPNGSTVITGNTGNGFSKITYLGE